MKLTSTRLWHSAISANSFRRLDPWIPSTGFRTNSLLYEWLFSHESASRLDVAESFLLNTCSTRCDRENLASIRSYFTDVGVFLVAQSGVSKGPNSDSVELPKPIKLKTGLEEIIRRRRSVRRFTGDSISLQYLSTVLSSSAGTTAYAETELSDGSSHRIGMRSVPSAGGLYPISIYIAAMNVDKLKPGVYTYAPDRHALEAVGDDSTLKRIISSFWPAEDQISLGQACAVIMQIGRPWKSMRKYGARGLRFVFLEAGSQAMAIHWATVAIGYGSCDCASVYDSEVHQALNIDGVHESLIHSIILGHPA